MKKFGGILLILLGIILIIISIFALVSAFEMFKAIGTDTENLGYVFGSILFPLLITGIGRWVYRRGNKILREK